MAPHQDTTRISRATSTTSLLTYRTNSTASLVSTPATVSSTAVEAPESETMSAMMNTVFGSDLSSLKSQVSIASTTELEPELPTQKVHFVEVSDMEEDGPTDGDIIFSEDEVTPCERQPSQVEDVLSPGGKIVSLCENMEVLSPIDEDEQSEESESEDDTAIVRELRSRNVSAGATHRVRKGKVTKKRKSPRLTMTKQKKISPARKEALQKILREEATPENFALGHLAWTEWKPVIKRHPSKNSAGKYQSRPNHVGYRVKTAYKNTLSPHVYEVAVETPNTEERYPVLACVNTGIIASNWERALLSKPKIQGQIDRVLRRGCKLYMRRAPYGYKNVEEVYGRCHVAKNSDNSRKSKIEAANELRGLIARVHDYPWRDHYDTETRTYSHRFLRRDGIVVSD